MYHGILPMYYGTLAMYHGIFSYGLEDIFYFLISNLHVWCHEFYCKYNCDSCEVLTRYVHTHTHTHIYYNG